MLPFVRHGVPIEIAVDCMYRNGEFLYNVLRGTGIPYAIKILIVVIKHGIIPRLWNVKCGWTKTLCRQDAAWPEIGATQFGTENTGCKRIIRTTVEHIRSGTSGKKMESFSLELDVTSDHGLGSCSSESDVPISQILEPCSLEPCHMWPRVGIMQFIIGCHKWPQVGVMQDGTRWWPYKDYIQTYSFLQSHTYVTHCQNKVEFKLCFLLSFICMLELLPYNLSPPCNNVTSNHSLAHTLTQNITWSCDVMSTKTSRRQASMQPIHHLNSLFLNSTPHKAAPW